MSDRISTGTRVSFNDPATGRLIDGRVVEHKVTGRGHRYRVRVEGGNKRAWFDAKDLVL